MNKQIYDNILDTDNMQIRVKDKIDMVLDVFDKDDVRQVNLLSEMANLLKELEELEQEFEELSKEL